MSTTKPTPKPKFEASFIKPLPAFVQDIIKRAGQADTAQQCAEFLNRELRAAGYGAVVLGDDYVAVDRPGGRTHWATLRKEQPPKDPLMQVAEQLITGAKP